MTEKIIKGRLVQKHDVESNWKLATNFIPKQGEVIIYDIDSNYNYERIKIGDGIKNVNALPFVSSTSLPSWNNNIVHRHELGCNQDLTWKKIFAISDTTNTLQSNMHHGCTVFGKIRYIDSNYHHSQVYEWPFEVCFQFYAGTTATDSCSLYMPATLNKDIIRVVRVDTNSFEIQIRQCADWKKTSIEYSYSIAGSSVTATRFDLVDVTNTNVICDYKTNRNVLAAENYALANHNHNSISGNAATATKATKDSDGNIIVDTYATKIELTNLVGDVTVSEQISSAIKKATADDFGVYVQEQEPVSAVVGDIWIDTANDPAYIPPTLPEITDADNGKVLMVVNGKLQLVKLNMSIDANGVISI